MKYAVNPEKARIMLSFCDEGEHIYEVTNASPTVQSVSVTLLAALPKKQKPTPSNGLGASQQWPDS